MPALRDHCRMTLEPFLSTGLAVQIHLVTALVALALGGVILFRKKGGKIHKLMGKFWVATFGVAVVSSAFISELQTFGRFSGIHLLTVFSAVSLVLAVFYIRSGNVTAHKRTMQALYLGALVGAGSLSLLPNRVMHRILFSEGEFVVSNGVSPTLLAFGTAALVFVGYWVYTALSQRSA